MIRQLKYWLTARPAPGPVRSRDRERARRRRQMANGTHGYPKVAARLAREPMSTAVGCLMACGFMELAGGLLGMVHAGVLS